MTQGSHFRFLVVRQLFRRVFSVSLLSLLVCLLIGTVAPARADDSADRRSQAKEQFARAENLRAQLEAKSQSQQSLQDWIGVVFAYRRVYLITPRAVEVPMALNEVGDLYNTMGQRFDRKYFTSAVETYGFLLHEYPENRYREDALLAIAGIERNRLAQSALARQAYQNFLQQYPHSEHIAEARRALAEMDAEDQLSTAAVIPSPPPTAPPSKEDDAVVPAASPPVASPPVASPNDGSGLSHIRVWNADTYTRIVIDLGGQAKYQAVRIFNPDRIYFDIDNAKLSRELIHTPIDVPVGGYLKTVRVAQNRPDVVRVVLEVAQVKDYSVFELANPDRLIVDVYGPDAKPGLAHAAKPDDSTPAAAALTKTALASAANLPSAQTGKSAPSHPSATSTGAAALADLALAPSAVPPSAASKSGRPALARRDPFSDNSVSADGATANSARNAGSTPALPVKETISTMGPASVPEPTRNGEQSLTRALGLKTSRIVIDAGHGGHDTGTIGPSGLMEKDLSLDVARRLGKLIQDRVPSAEVIYTRDDDSYVSLEQRTAIANQAKADLFLSIHANSSDDHSVTGVETYYLNFNASNDALVVAARENALAQGSVHDLQDLVKKIADNEKIEESRDLAGKIQDALATHVARQARRDRGVRRAPFVVLIGANMPSVLSEISFLSNPEDEQWLKKPENRQQIAEGLFQGIQSYLHSTNSLASNLASSAAEPPSRATAVAHAGNPQ